ncbi:DUF4907 domain-containing protein [Psychroflexus sp. MES1-P1E]|jgi:hypothetical protein|uniref:DUF4907 domain-containing protein n=1 Tax=Psychroflexus sp. MES1-P1E TaxID=2058320 RepID=UPI000C7CCF23|nr:DUF4907 domain-containing protein [Psychroflexus sp. MES1-P1E]PKG43763.1 DUF4907 domain-containing protein [Psychroflexus sp. MES1-P1E]
MKKTTGFIITIGLIVITFLLVANKDQSIGSKTFGVDTGFGYEITNKKKVLIKQNHIPAIQESKPFYSKEDADKVANLVISKLKNKKSPTVSLKELAILKIQTNALK